MQTPVCLQSAFIQQVGEKYQSEQSQGRNPCYNKTIDSEQLDLPLRSIAAAGVRSVRVYGEADLKSEIQQHADISIVNVVPSISWSQVACESMPPTARVVTQRNRMCLVRV
jgi:hypothetical protein